MKNKILGLLISTILLSVTNVGIIYAVRGNVAAIVTRMIGTLKMKPAASNNWVDVKPGSFVNEGDEVRTGKNSRVALTFISGSEVKLDANSEFKVEKDEAVRGSGNTVRLKKGRSLVNAFVKGTKFSMHTPVATIAIRGTVFGADVGDVTNVLVLEGVVEAKNEYGSVNINANEQTTIGASGAPPPPTPVTSTEKIDEWKKFDQTTESQKGSIKVTSGIKEDFAGMSIRLKIQAVDDKGKEDDKNSSELSLMANSPTATFSVDEEKTWGAKKVKLDKGSVVIAVKDTVPGDLMVSVTGSTNHTPGGMGLKFKPLPSAPKNKQAILKIKTETGEEEEIKIKFEK